MLTKLTKSGVVACLLDAALLWAERVQSGEDGPLLQARQVGELEDQNEEDWLGLHPIRIKPGPAGQEPTAALLAEVDSKELSVLDHFEGALDWLVGDCKAGFFVCRYHGTCKINDSGKDLAYWETYMKELKHRKSALLASFQELGVEAEVDAMMAFCNAAPTLALLDPPSFFADELEKHRQTTLAKASRKESAPTPSLPVLTSEAAKYFPNGIPKPASIQEVQEAVRIHETAQELSALEMLKAQESIGGFEGALGWLVGDCKAGYLLCRYHGTCDIHENAEDLAYWETYMKELNARKNALVTSFEDLGRPLGVTVELNALIKLCNSAPDLALLDPPSFFTDELEAHMQKTLAKANQEQYQEQETAPRVEAAAPQAEAMQSRKEDYDVPKISAMNSEPEKKEPEEDKKWHDNLFR